MGIRTGQVPPSTIRSNDKAGGMPLLMHELQDWIDSLIDFCFSSPLRESAEELTCEGRR